MHTIALRLLLLLGTSLLLVQALQRGGVTHARALTLSAALVIFSGSRSGSLLIRRSAWTKQTRDVIRRLGYLVGVAASWTPHVPTPSNIHRLGETNPTVLAIYFHHSRCPDLEGTALKSHRKFRAS